MGECVLVGVARLTNMSTSSQLSLQGNPVENPTHLDPGLAWLRMAIGGGRNLTRISERGIVLALSGLRLLSTSHSHGCVGGFEGLGP